MLANKNNQTSDDNPAGDDSVNETSAGAESQAAGADAAEHCDSTSDQLQSQLADLKQELNHAHDQALRAQADFENYRKRMTREIQESQRYAAMTIARDLLPVMDNLGRAVEAAEKVGEGSTLLTGVQMVSQQLNETLARHGLEPIAAEGEMFDPERHEAVSQQPSGDVKPGTVLIVVQTGYRLGDRVVRPAKVIVAREP